MASWKYGGTLQEIDKYKKIPGTMATAAAAVSSSIVGQPSTSKVPPPPTVEVEQSIENQIVLKPYVNDQEEVVTGKYYRRGYGYPPPWVPKYISLPPSLARSPSIPIVTGKYYRRGFGYGYPPRWVPEYTVKLEKPIMEAKAKELVTAARQCKDFLMYLDAFDELYPSYPH